MLIRFIAHAGIYLEEYNTQLLIDPWFRGSSISHPRIESAGLAGSNRTTIDFQVPPTTQKIETYTPRIILLSHFHAHHAPLRDIEALVQQSKKVTIAYPILDEDVFSERFARYEQVDLKPVRSGDEFTVQNFRMRALAHTTPNHISWFVAGDGGSILHIADAQVNKDRFSRHLDPLWDEYEELAADIIFLSVGGNCLKEEDKEGNKYISDARVLTPGEAANLLQKLSPKAAVPIGCYNKSLWSTMREYVPPSYVIEDQLYWALSWTAPEVRPIFLKPGSTIRMKSKGILGSGKEADYQILT